MGGLSFLGCKLFLVEYMCLAFTRMPGILGMCIYKRSHSGTIQEALMSFQLCAFTVLMHIKSKPIGHIAL